MHCIFKLFVCNAVPICHFRDTINQFSIYLRVTDKSIACLIKDILIEWFILLTHLFAVSNNDNLLKFFSIDLKFWIHMPYEFLAIVLCLHLSGLGNNPYKSVVSQGHRLHLVVNITD